MNTEPALMIIDDEPDFVFTVRIPKNSDRSTEGTFPRVTGLIQEDQWGFSHTIDMAYKGKPDQCSDFFMKVETFMTKDDFKEVCKDNGIPIYE